MRVDDDFRIRFNSELYELLNDIDVVQRIKIQRLLWLSHVVRMEEDAPAKWVLDAGICGVRRRGRPCIRWKDQIEEALSSIGVTNCVGAQKAEAPGRMYCGRPKSVNRVVIAK